MGFYSTFYVWWVYFCDFFFWLLVYLIAIVIAYWCYWTIKYIWQYSLMTCSTNTYNNFFHTIHGLNLHMGFLNFFKNLFFNLFFFFIPRGINCRKTWRCRIWNRIFYFNLCISELRNVVSEKINNDRQIPLQYSVFSFVKATFRIRHGNNLKIFTSFTENKNVFHI